ncbi:MAG: dihydroxyacetone kinase subunit DhaK, partial [Reyranella sp.]|nr:dihydroxyacetone kinase subunit DhaK [Reyranella sp.]
MQFINGTESLVVDAIDGLLRSSGGANLARLDGYPGIKVVLRTDHRPGRVAIVAGGGSGHEPAHASFVGKGMLTAAVCGDVFASPSVDAVFAAIMAVTGKSGCLVIFKNYTGDRLNFGLAVERARTLGRKVEVVIVKDDIALPHLPQPRGIAGVMFVEKVAGHYAEQGANLKTVAAMARKAADAVVSLGISLSSCTLPGVGREDRVP